MQLGDVGRQGFRVAGDVENVVEAPGQLASVRVHAGAGRVDEDAAEFVAFQVDAMQATERAHFVQRFGQFFSGQTHQSDIIHSVFAEIAQRCVDRGLADFSGQHFAHASSERQGEVAVAAIQLQ
ncbi:hypothetical protein D3C71_1642850 [compost metagenome]